MKISIFDVAKKSGLSVVTVSRVLNNSSSVRQKNKEKVLKAMKELNYQPNAAARSLARGKTGIIGLTLTTLDDSFLDAVVKETNERLGEHGYLLALSIARSFEDAFRRSLFQEDRVDGVILLSPTDEDEFIMELKNKKIPLVLVDNSKSHPSVSSVIVDNFKGGYEVGKHLIELGHTDIAHIAGPDPFLSSRERERGFLTALEEAGLKPRCIERGTFSMSSGYEIATRWIDAGELPSALFAADDYIALGVIDACLNRGVRIPEQLSIVGFDDQKFASEFRPKLTTVRQPADKIGAAGVELLLEAMNDPAKRQTTVTIEPTLIVRESTARKK
ncbi:LacI family transcriptional regulator [Cohnella sp. CIP 111063]|mgnify:CR=1 FL=1|uniref:LacI family DNA-binding transcriptional regulator n=1 Tax=unclassified Cohnella TaxID=2636738 RepID=UPI000B8BD6DD|nr:MULTISPECIES: LacI family DNA-binding transcriptional regulator [unclassified Cohnella]OXS57681.1 LacI family transcriptional regulator [Cohnella sp. CIP 111063]PRX71072.1 LacI family transcriptional regulator [Cohnella sp. SGD-V74]